MKKLILGILITAVTLLSGLVYLLIEDRNKNMYQAPEQEYGRYEITCSPVYGMVLNYIHYGYAPRPDAHNNMYLFNAEGEMYMLYNMTNCIIIETDLNKNPTPSKLPMLNPRPKEELTV